MVVPTLSVLSFHDTLAVLFSYAQEFYILVSTKSDVHITAQIFSIFMTIIPERTDPNP